MANDNAPSGMIIHRRPPGGDDVPVGDIRFDDQSKHGTKSVKVTMHGTKEGHPATVWVTKASENAKHDPLYFFGPETPYYTEVYNVVSLHAEIEAFIDESRTATQLIPVDWVSHVPEEVLGGGTLSIDPEDQGHYFPSLKTVSPV